MSTLVNKNRDAICSGLAISDALGRVVHLYCIFVCLGKGPKIKKREIMVFDHQGGEGVTQK